jgi:hypothetical protein
MSSWVEKKAQFESRKNALNTYINKQYDVDVREFNRAAQTFVEGLGMDGSPTGQEGSAFLQKVYTHYSNVKSKLKEAQQLKDDISEYIIGISSAGDVQQILQQIGALQLEVVNLEDKIKDADVSDTAAKERADAIANRYKDVSRHQTLTTIGRPLEKRSYMYLFPIGISLFVVAIFLLWPGIRGILSLPAGAGSFDLPFYKTPTFIYTIMGLMASAVVVGALIVTGVIR